MSQYEAGARVAVRAAPLEIEAATAFGWAIAFGICAVSLYVLRGLFAFSEGTAGALIGWVPGVGKWVNSKLEHAEQKLTHWVGQAAASSEQRMADAFHASADLAQSLAHEVMGEAIATWHIAQWTSHVAWVALKGHHLAQGAWLRGAADEAHLKALERASRAHGKALTHADAPPIGAGIRTATKPIAARTTWIDTRELPGIRARQRARDQAIPQDQAGIRARTREAEGGIERLWDKVRHLDRVTTGVLASALVMTALGRLGMGWLRCSSINRIGNRLCRLDTRLLEGLLGASVITFAVSDLCEFTHLLSQAAQKAEPLLLDFVRAEDALIDCHGTTKPPGLPLRKAPLPPLQTAAALPSL